MTTLVLCIDRDGGLTDEPVVGWEAVRALVTDVGVDDPEDARVNCLLESLRVTRDLRDDGEDAVVGVVSGAGDALSADRAVARDVDELVETHEPDGVVVVVASAEAERLVPIIESRVRVDGVDRVVVRQSHDIESTYYLLKQFLADEELRGTVLVPLGATLLAFPLLLFLAESITLAVAAIAAGIGVFFLYKGLGVDNLVENLPGAVKEAFYSGRVSIVTYVIGAGLALVGIVAGAIGVRAMGDTSVFLLGLRFVYGAVPWVAAAALVASTGRLIDGLLADEGVRSSLLNLPFGVVAVGLVVRGFAAYFLERAGVIPPVSVPPMALGNLVIRPFTLSVWTRLALLVVAGVTLSLVGIRFASYVGGGSVEDLTRNP